MRLQRINLELKFFDKELYAVKSDAGLTQIYRKGIRWESFHFGGHLFHYSRLNPHYVLSLTKDWSLTAEPVEWGLEPLLGRLREIDSHNHDVLGRISKDNFKREEIRKQSQHNDFRAIAADARKDFSKAVNDINTSTLNKVESRRKKDAYCSKRP